MPDALRILEEAKSRGCRVILPADIMVGDSLEPGCKTRVQKLFLGCCTPEDPCIAPGLFGGDIGPETIEHFADAIAAAKTVFWNGPMGKFEVPEYLAVSAAPVARQHSLRGRPLDRACSGDPCRGRVASPRRWQMLRQTEPSRSWAAVTRSRRWSSLAS